MLIPLLATALMTPPPEPQVDPRVAVINDWKRSSPYLTAATDKEVLRLLDMVKEAGHG